MVINPTLLEKTCKEMIETILLCLGENAYKGTIYLVGRMPELQTVRITSGIRKDGMGDIHWGLQETSDYEYPGRSWEQYKDRPSRVLEAMGWCVERQKSWTADNPQTDARSVRKQLCGEIEDFHHMEPVLVKKSKLFGETLQRQNYPLDWQGNAIWEDCEHVVAAVIKIHFLPYTIKRGDISTKIIKRLSRTLGTEMFSLHINELSVAAQRQLTLERMYACNTVAHELRNIFVELGFVFSAINAEISYLREQWEHQIEGALPHIEGKKTVLSRLDQLLTQQAQQFNGEQYLVDLCTKLSAEQLDFASLSLLPQNQKTWLDNKIRPKWHRLLTQSDTSNQLKQEVEGLLENLERNIWIGLDENLTSKMHHLPEDLKIQWSKIAYTDFNLESINELNDVLKLLDHPALNIPHKHQTRKVLLSLKVLAEIIPKIEERINRIIFTLKNGPNSSSSNKLHSSYAYSSRSGQSESGQSDYATLLSHEQCY
ncbi:MAG: hypothetical protein RBS57_13410 [Desulforhabdus sp.]|jgi:hypothetical protein|nr:hypothetical protein [Desulforhabdus sp.]